MRASSTAAEGARTFERVLAARAERDPDLPVLTFLEDGESTESVLTYAQLDARARAVGALVRAHTRPGDRVVLLFPPGLDYIAGLFGCFHARVIAVPAYPPDPSRLGRTLPRLTSIMRDAGPAAVLTTAEIAAVAEVLGAETPELAEPRWLSVGDARDPEDREPEPSSPGEVAVLQYTSGSTGDPKGVMLTHANLLHNSEMIARKCSVSRRSHMVSWLPPYHDMGLIGGILQPIYSGFPATLMSPIAFLARPARWLEAISRRRGTVAGAPNFAYDLCVRRVGEEVKRGLDLSSWELAFNAAELIRPETLDAFATAFASCGFRRDAFYTCYGLAEATLMVTGSAVLAPTVLASLDEAALGEHRAQPAGPGAAGAARLVGCGTAPGDQRVLIVDPATSREAGPGEVGEIWVSGPSVAAGYWRNQGATAETFEARLVPGGDGPFLRTGDLGFLDGRELFVTGRIKDVLKIRGRSYYPTDIERAAEAAHPRLRRSCSAAFTVTDGERGERLVVVAEVDPALGEEERDEAIRAIRGAVASSLDLQVHWVVLLEPRQLPKTSSGKVQRSLCRSQLAGERLEGILASHRVAAPW